MKKLISKFKITKESIIELISWVVGAVVLVIISEYMQRPNLEKVLSFAKDRTNAFCINLLLIMLLTSVIFITKRKKTIYLIVSMLIIGLSIANKVLLEIRGMPLTYSDVYSIKDGLTIANKYIDTKMVLIAGGLILATTLLVTYLFKKEKNNKRITSYTNILIVIVLSLTYTTKLQDLKERQVIVPMRWDLKASYVHNGYMYSLVDSYFGYKRTKPRNYDKANIEEIKNNVNAVEASNINGSNKIKNPNIIFVQLESFMDPTLIKNTKYSEDPIPNFRKIANENKSGYINVPVFGGGTARTEFEILTGYSFDYLTPGEIPYDTFVKEKNINSMASTLKPQGYNTNIMHNHEGNFYNRNQAFKNMGFDRYTSIEYMNNVEKTHLNWAKDNVLLEYIEKALNKDDNKDLIYAITVECHGSYPTDDRGIDLPVKVETSLSNEDKNQLYNYVNLLKETDKLVGDIVEMVDKSEEDTIVVFFSDHLPKLNVLSREDSEIDKYEAPYTIYSNFKVDKENLDLEAYQLSTLMFGLSGVDNGIMENLHLKEGNNEDYQNKLELVQYDTLFGKDYYLSNNKEENKNYKMGLEDILVEKTDIKDNIITIKGKNFTHASYVFVNGKKVDTRYIDENTLEIDKKDNIKNICVKQLGRYDGELSSSNTIQLNK